VSGWNFVNIRKSSLKELKEDTKFLFQEEFGWILFYHEHVPNRGWKLHVRIDRNKILDFLDEFLPVIKKYVDEGRKIEMKVATQAFSKYLDLEYTKNQQVGKVITLYVDREEKDLIPILTFLIDYIVEKKGIDTVYNQLKREGFENPGEIMKEIFLGKTNAVTMRWSSYFSPKNKREEEIDNYERTTNAYRVILKDYELRKEFEKIYDKTRELSTSRLISRKELSSAREGDIISVKLLEGGEEVYRLAKIVNYKGKGKLTSSIYRLLGKKDYIEVQPLEGPYKNKTIKLKTKYVASAAYEERFGNIYIAILFAAISILFFLTLPSNYTSLFIFTTGNIQIILIFFLLVIALVMLAKKYLKL
jgi:hypothetical protein